MAVAYNIGYGFLQFNSHVGSPRRDVDRPGRGEGGAAQGEGQVTAREVDRARKYRDLALSYAFAPVAVETMGVWGPAAVDLIRELGRRIGVVSGDPRSTFYLRQRIEVAVLRGNAISVLGTFPTVSDTLDPF